MHVLLTDKKIYVKKQDEENTIVLQGTRSPADKMWYIELEDDKLTNSKRQVNSAYEINKKEEIIKYLSAAMWNPVPQTWMQAIEAGFFATWPGLTSKLVRKYLTRTVETDKGHLRADRKNARSTKVQESQATSKRSNEFYAKTIELNGKVFSDQTGRFPVTSSKGNKYIMVMCDHDSNAILTKPLKSKSATEHLQAIKEVHACLNQKGIHPKVHIMDNECSSIVKDYLKNEKKIELLLAPPYLHRINTAEKAIDIFKCHFITGLATVDPSFPLHLWCRLLDLATTTLNLLRPSRINPKLSAHELLEGTFDYNKTPIAPPGCKVLAHDSVDKRKTWDAHGVDGWYIGTAPNHCRCHKICTPSTRSERIAKTVKFYPHKVKIPSNNKAEEIALAAARLTDALKAHPVQPIFKDKNTTASALNKLAEIFLKRHKVQVDVKKEPLPQSPRVREENVKLTKPKQTEQQQPVTRVHTQRPNIVCETDREKRHRLRNEAKTVPQFSPQPSAPIITTCKEALTKDKQQARTLPALIEPDDDAPSTTHLINSVLHSTGELLEYRHLIQGPDAAIWKTALANDLGRLAQGVGTRMQKGTNTISFIHPKDIPKNKKITCVKLVSSMRPLKSEVHRVRVTIGGDRLEYAGKTSSVPATLQAVKILLNSTISTPNARFLTVDIKDFYHGTPMAEKDYEHAQMPLNLIPEEIVKQYNLNKLAVNGKVCFEVRKGMPGLKQAGIIANERLSEYLKEAGYMQSKFTPSLWKHKKLDVSFTLVVDDFGIKCVNKKNANHLISTLQKHYTISVDWTGRKYLGLTIAWDYFNRHVTISMPDYIKKALLRFQHEYPQRPVHAPAKYTPPKYGEKIQYAEPEKETEPLSEQELKKIQEVVGTFLYYGRALDSTMLVAIGDLAAAQSKGNKETMQQLTHLLNYAATHPDAQVRFYASGMILHVHSDGSYLSVARGRSRAGGYFFLSNNEPDPAKAKINGAVHVLCVILKNVMGSAAETEIAATFDNAKEALPLRQTLKFLGHPQPPTPIQVDNTTAVGFANESIKQKRSKAIDMRFYWLQDRSRQNQFKMCWGTGENNLGDYYTKHFSEKQHIIKRPIYLFEPKRLINHTFQNFTLKFASKRTYFSKISNMARA